MTTTAAAKDTTTRARLGSVGRNGLKIILLAATGNRCAICADALVLDAPATHPKRLQISHVKPALGEDRGGWVSGNLFAGCGECNDLTGKKDLTNALPLFRIVEGVAVWTDTDARRAGKNTTSAKIITNGHADLWTKINSAV